MLLLNPPAFVLYVSWEARSSINIVSKKYWRISSFVCFFSIGDLSLEINWYTRTITLSAGGTEITYFGSLSSRVKCIFFIRAYLELPWPKWTENFLELHSLVCQGIKDKPSFDDPFRHLNFEDFHYSWVCLLFGLSGVKNLSLISILVETFLQ